MDATSVSRRTGRPAWLRPATDAPRARRSPGPAGSPAHPSSATHASRPRRSGTQPPGRERGGGAPPSQQHRTIPGPRLPALATIGGVTIPSRDPAALLLLDLGAPPSLVRHMAAVAEIAADLAARVAARGVAVDRRLVEAAALLHDMDKAFPPDDPLRALGHGHAGAEWLARHGWAELSPAVDAHPVMRLASPAGDRWLENATLEERIVAYADKRAAARLGPVDARFARWYRRHPEHADGLRAARSRVDRLERDVCEAAGIAPDAVRRLPWVRAALDRAAALRAGAEA